MNASRATQMLAARNRALAAIHIAKTQLAMDDDAYRALLRRVSAANGAEVDSAARLNERQTHAVLDAMRRLGAVRPGAHKAASYPGKPHNFYGGAMPEMITKIEAQLADMGLGWAYADAIALRQTGIARCAWVRSEKQLKGIIAALDVEQTKRACNAYIDQMLPLLGIDAKQWAEMTAALPKNWRRNRTYLDRMCTQLQARLDMLKQREQTPISHPEGVTNG